MQNVLAQHEAREAARPIYEFDLPPDLVSINDTYIKRSVGMVKLTMQEELDAIDAARRDAGKTAYHMVMKALVEGDGRKVNKGEAEEYTIVNYTDPAIRSLLV